MGRILSYEDIPSLPQEIDFQKAKKRGLDKLGALADKDIIYGAQIIGSVATGNPSIRSDLDIVIVYNSFQNTDELKAFLEALSTIFKEVSNTTHVPIEATIVDLSQAREARHDIHQDLLENLDLSPWNGNSVGKSIRDAIKPRDTDYLELLMGYLSHKLNNLHKRFTSSDPSDLLEVLKDTFECPANSGRKVLQAFNGEFGNSRRVLDENYDGTKESVVRNFLRIMNPDNNSELDHRITNHYVYLVERDRNYTQFLLETAQGKHSQQEYESYLTVLKECIPVAIEWMTLMNEYAERVIKEHRRELAETREGIVSHQSPSPERFYL